MYLLASLISKPEIQPLGRVFLLRDNPKDESKGVRAKVDLHIAHMKLWSSAFDALSKISYAEGESNMIRAAILKMHVNTVYLCMRGFLGADKMVYDDYFEEFKEVVDLAEMVLGARAKESKSTSFAVDLGVILPLQIAAQKCRYRSIRRKAIALMLGNVWREGIWDSMFAGKMMEWGVSVEEDFLENGNIPPWARVQGVAMSEELQPRTACQQRKSERSDELVIRQKVIHW
jgi:hypothetical protein